MPRSKTAPKKVTNGGNAFNEALIRFLRENGVFKYKSADFEVEFFVPGASATPFIQDFGADESAFAVPDRPKQKASQEEMDEYVDKAMVRDRFIRATQAKEIDEELLFHST